jgi:hypothetical protein
MTCEGRREEERTVRETRDITQNTEGSVRQNDRGKIIGPEGL